MSRVMSTAPRGKAKVPQLREVYLGTGNTIMSERLSNDIHGTFRSRAAALAAISEFVPEGRTIGYKVVRFARSKAQS